MVLFEEFFKPFKMVLIVDFAAVSRIHCILVVKGLLNFSEQDFLKGLVDFLMNVEMIGSYTGLSTVKVLPKDDSDSCTLKISSFVYNDWTFASQL